MRLFCGGPARIGDGKQALITRRSAAFRRHVLRGEVAPFFDFGAGRLLGIDVATKISRATTIDACPDNHEPVLLDVLSGALLCSCREFRPLPECVPNCRRTDGRFA